MKRHAEPGSASAVEAIRSSIGSSTGALTTPPSELAPETRQDLA
jgi:hypothetical protein